jgi:histone H2A
MSKKRDQFHVAIYRVLKLVHPYKGISTKAVSILNDMLKEVFFRVLLKEARLLADMNKRILLTSREIHTACRYFPGELAKQAVSEGCKAVTTYNSHLRLVGAGRPRRETKSMRAGLTFPVGKIHRLVRSYLHGYKISIGFSVYLAAVLEYLAAEILELSGNAARVYQMKRIAPRHLMLAIRGDEELDLLFSGSIASAGVVPYIHKSLDHKVEGPTGVAQGLIFQFPQADRQNVLEINDGDS